MTPSFACTLTAEGDLAIELSQDMIDTRLVRVARFGHSALAARGHQLCLALDQLDEVFQADLWRHGYFHVQISRAEISAKNLERALGVSLPRRPVQKHCPKCGCDIQAHKWPRPA